MDLGGVAHVDGVNRRVKSADGGLQYETLLHLFVSLMTTKMIPPLILHGGSGITTLPL